MGVRYDASADSLHYATVANLPSAATHSFCCWLRLQADRNDFSCLFYLNGNNADGEIFLSTATDGVTMELTDSATALNLGALSVGTWYFLAYQRTNTARAAFLGTEAGGSLTKVSNAETKNRNTAYGASGRIQLGNDIYTEWVNGDLAYARVWSGVALSDAEMDAEWKSATPVRTSNLWADYPLAAAASATTDASGNGRTLTLGGTLADAGNPTIPSGSAGWGPLLSTTRNRLVMA